jgi:ribosomal protein S18 acetylase RimI-like enzyme
MNDYDAVYQLWKMTPGVGLRSMDDSREGIEQFLRRNPTTNFVTEEEGQIIAAALSGHDGRRGYLYHVCVAEGNRRRRTGRQLVEQVIEAMKAEKITRLALVCFTDNETGNRFWSRLGWTYRPNLNYYTIGINENNQ